MCWIGAFGYSRAIHSRASLVVAVAKQECCERGVGLFPLRLCERGLNVSEGAQGDAFGVVL